MKSGCGSTATTRAPSARQARTRLPTCAPTSKPMSPGPEERAVEPHHPPVPARHAVVHHQRAGDPVGAAEHDARPYRRPRAATRAFTAARA